MPTPALAQTIDIARLEGHHRRGHVRLHRSRLDHRARHQPDAASKGIGFSSAGHQRRTIAAALSANASTAFSAAIGPVRSGTATAASSSPYDLILYIRH